MSISTNFSHRLHSCGTETVLEVWPNSGFWDPFTAVVPPDERHKLTQVYFAPPGNANAIASVNGTNAWSADGLQGMAIRHRIDASNSAYVQFSALPSKVRFGQPDKTYGELVFVTR